MTSERTRLEEIRERDAASRTYEEHSGIPPQYATKDRRWLLEQVDEMVKAISMQRPRQFGDAPCFCQTAAGTYCVAQPACGAINKALAALHAKETDRG